MDPHKCLPICVDVGTNNEALLADPAYPGLKQKRVRGQEYDAFIEEFIEALRAWQPHMLLQFEDFGNTTAFQCASVRLPAVMRLASAHWHCARHTRCCKLSSHAVLSHAVMLQMLHPVMLQKNSAIMLSIQQSCCHETFRADCRAAPTRALSTLATVLPPLCALSAMPTLCALRALTAALQPLCALPALTAALPPLCALPALTAALPPLEVAPGLSLHAQCADATRTVQLSYNEEI